MIGVMLFKVCISVSNPLTLSETFVQYKIKVRIWHANSLGQALPDDINIDYLVQLADPARDTVFCTTYLVSKYCSVAVVAQETVETLNISQLLTSHSQE